MKKTFIILALVMVYLVLAESCSDNFNLNAPYKEVDALNCILQNDSTIQYAILSRNVYTATGAEPTSTDPGQFIQGANVKIFYNNSVFVMKDTTIQVTESGNNTWIYCYYTRNLILEPGKAVQIEATTPSGKTFKSSIITPQISFKSLPVQFPQTYGIGFLTQLIYSWNWLGGAGMTNVLSLPQFEIFYQKYENGSYIDKKILLPLIGSILIDNSTGIQTFVNVEPSYNTSCSISFDVINKTLREISGNDPNKSNYIINKVVFSVIGLDSQLSKFYYASNIFQESFTLKVRPSDYTNIEGGEGIFGAYYKFSKPLIIDSIYIRSFGYRYDPH